MYPSLWRLAVDQLLESSPHVMQSALCTEGLSLQAAFQNKTFSAACASIWMPFLMLLACLTCVTAATCRQCAKCLLTQPALKTCMTPECQHSAAWTPS